MFSERSRGPEYISLVEGHQSCIISSNYSCKKRLASKMKTLIVLFAVLALTFSQVERRCKESPSKWFGYFREVILNSIFRLQLLIIFCFLRR